MNFDDPAAAIAPEARSDRLRNKASRNAARKKPMPWDERHAQLISVAREIVHHEGIGALTMSALSERSGASKPIVYEHFDNREEVAIQLMDDSYRKITAYVAERVAGAETIQAYMDMVIDSLFDIQSRDFFSVRSITNGFSSTSEVNRFYLAQQKRNHAIIIELLRQQHVPDAIAEVGAYALMVMINETVAQFVNEDSAAGRETLRRVVDGALRSLLADKAERPSLPADILNAPHENPAGKAKKPAR